VLLIVMRGGFTTAEQMMLEFGQQDLASVLRPRTTLRLMEREHDPSEDERRRRLAELDSAALERDRLFNAALIEEAMASPGAGVLDRRLGFSARSPRV
jgi:hypothetical protein